MIVLQGVLKNYKFAIYNESLAIIFIVCVMYLYACGVCKSLCDYTKKGTR